MRYFLQFFAAGYFLLPVYAIASVSDCLDVSINSVSLSDQISSVASLIGYSAAASGLLLIALYKFLRLQNIPQKHSVAYLVAAPVLYFLIRWEIMRLTPYYDVGGLQSCKGYFTVDERIIYGGLFGLFYLIAAALFLWGTRLEGKKFETYQNLFFAVLSVYVLLNGSYLHSYIWRSMELGN